ncbi:MAG: NUDIX family hydrolase [Parcubacteria group bacterium Gr01-1014_31]|nr:MAG: NUDIX family hydrolase [Parcubacteria group bacterium Gr01-1014_31]
MPEVLDIVDARDVVIGQAEMGEVYRRKLGHRVVHVLVLHPERRAVYLQRRAETKSYLPGYWCTSAGGHVRSGESYAAAAARELREELGLTVPLSAAHAFVYSDQGHQRFVQLFVAFAGEGFQFADGEVAYGEFYDLESARALVEGGFRVHPQVPPCFSWLYANQARFYPSEK